MTKAVQSWPSVEGNIFPAGLLIIGLVHVAGLPLPVMEIDAAQYASIAREMWEGGSWLEVKHRGEDYLDKPPLLFWTAALSMGLFGFNDFAYKLPALLFALLGVYSVYRLTRRYYAPETAQLAALALAGCLYTFRSTNDVRTDTHLMGAVAFASWQLLAYWDDRKRHYLLGASVGIGLALLAKGPIGLIVPASGLFVHILQQKAWRKLVDLQLWVVSILVVGLLLAPMLMGLYRQWGSDGPYFFFWKQSFGRITGESEWTSDGGFSLFFFYGLLWMFLPFTPLLLAGLVRAFRCFRKLPEAFSLGAFLLPFLALSFSRYKLDHYIYVCFPFAAMLASGYVQSLTQKANQRWGRGMLLQLVLVVGLFAWIAGWLFAGNVYGWVGLAVWLAGAAYLLVRHVRAFLSLVPVLLLTAIALGLAMNTALYPRLLQYQSQSKVMEILQLIEPAESWQLFTYRYHSHLLHFGHGENVRPIGSLNEVYEFQINNPDTLVWVYTDSEGARELVSSRRVLTSAEPCVNNSVERNQRPELDSETLLWAACISFQHFPVTRLTPSFLNRAKRKDVLEERYLYRVAPPDSANRRHSVLPVPEDRKRP